MNGIRRLAGLLIASSVLFSTCSNDKPTAPPAELPTVSTAAVTGITDTAAEGGGMITSDGGAAVTARGVCWSTNPAPTTADHKTDDGSGAGSFISSITGLAAGTTYYVRAYAVNSVGTDYGNEVSFGTMGTVTDVDGNTYQTVKIGNQWWMAENLRVTSFRNGNPIAHAPDMGLWRALSTGAYCSHMNDANNIPTYGLLYNWHAVNDGRHLAPGGWHVPTDTEWQTLVDHLGGSAVAGGRMKEAGTEHWHVPNTGTKDSGFDALPGGFRTYSGFFGSLGYSATFWSSTQYDTALAWERELLYDYSIVVRDSIQKGSGFSVRCIKD